MAEQQRFPFWRVQVFTASISVQEKCQDSGGVFVSQDMTIQEEEILSLLMKSRDRIAAASWIVVRDAQVAEDIFQNVTIKALTKNVEFYTEAELLSWAFVTARREAIDWARRTNKEKFVPGPEVVNLLEQEWVASSEHEAPRAKALQDCLKQVSGKISELLKLRYYDGLSCSEVANRLGSGLDAIYKRLSRAHQALRNCIESRLQGTPAPDPGGESK